RPPRALRARQLTDLLPSGEDAWIVQMPLDFGWRILLFSPDTALKQAFRQRLTVWLAALLLVSAGTWFAVWVQMRRVVRPTQRILSQLEALADGRAVERMTRQSVPRELWPLAHRIARLADRLQSAHEDNATLDQLNRTDPLTGCLNRRGLDHHLAQFVEGGCLTGPLGVVALDIDFFKHYNDHYGHLAGDSVLRRVAGAVQGCLRDPLDVIARTGGEEFLILLAQKDHGSVRAIAERFRAAVSDLHIPHESSALERVTVSIGVVTGHAGDRVDELIHQSDLALYRAKAEGRNRVVG
ncbi:MAG TPA: GGDEF domain-containing protein, partial [Lysobacter sp.]